MDGRAATTEAHLRALAERLDELAPMITERIRAEVPDYAALPADEHAHDVDSQIRGAVAGLLARQPPPAEAIEHARKVGRRRAARNLPLPSVVEAYHIAYRELWNELLGLAQAEGPEQAGALVGEVALLWNWFHRLSATVAESHAEETRLRATTRAALRRRFVGMLRGSSRGAEEQDALARQLGFDPDDEFVLARADEVPETRIEELDNRLAEMAGTVQCSWDAGSVVVMAQGCRDADLLDAVHAVVADARVAVGLPRRGVDGARLSLLDADDALLRSRAVGADVRFADDWLLATLGASSHRLEALLSRGAGVARTNPALAATVRAFADGRSSVTACARILQIHPNSAKYRLDRWQALTGWDLQTFPGLVSSLVCLGLFAPSEARAPAGSHAAGNCAPARRTNGTSVHT
ncbi:helix-turn-helix domain-containing protein [Pseudonocardia yunnanensis]